MTERPIRLATMGLAFIVASASCSSERTPTGTGSRSLEDAAADGLDLGDRDLGEHPDWVHALPICNFSTSEVLGAQQTSGYVIGASVLSYAGTGEVVSVSTKTVLVRLVDYQDGEEFLNVDSTGGSLPPLEPGQFVEIDHVRVSQFSEDTVSSLRSTSGQHILFWYDAVFPRQGELKLDGVPSLTLGIRDRCMRMGGCYDKWTMFDAAGTFGTEDFIVPLFQKRFYDQSGHRYEMALSFGEWKEADRDEACSLVDDFRGPQMRFSLTLVE